MSQPLPTPTEVTTPTGAETEDLHILGRLSKKFPQKAAKRAVWAFSSPPRLEAPETLAGFEPQKSRSGEGLMLHTWGKNAHKKALLVHGWGLQGAAMQSFVPGLLEKDFQVMAFDGLAHGESPGTRATGADFARSILSLSEEFDGFDVIIGHSVGGAAASIALGKGAKIKRAALLAPAYLPEIVDNFARLVDLPDNVKSIFLDMLAIDARWPLEDWRQYNLATDIQQPVVIFHDPEDQQVSIVHSRRFIDLAQRAVLFEVPEAGHNSILQNPAVVAQIVRFADSF